MFFYAIHGSNVDYRVLITTQKFWVRNNDRCEAKVYNQGGHNNTERGEDVKHALHCDASHCNALKS